MPPKTTPPPAPKTSEDREAGIPPPEGTNSAQSRNIFGTLTVPPERRFNGTDQEKQVILQILRDICPSITKLMLQREVHTKGENKGMYHYHFLVCTGSPMRSTKLQALLQRFNKQYPGRHDVQFAKSVSAVEQYHFKYYAIHEPYTEGYSDDDITELKRKADDDTPKMVKTTNANRWEDQILEQVSEFMEANHFKVNYYTRQLHNQDGKNHRAYNQPAFFEQLTKETDMLKEYGQRGYKLIQDYIKDPTLHALPYFKPNRDFIGFNNAMYSFTAGKRYDLDDPILKDVAPIRHFYMDFPSTAPTSYLYLIKHHKWDLAGFIKHYGSMFKPKEHRDLAMYLWGPPVTGKSMFYIPLIEVFGDLVGNFTKDGKFSLSTLPDKLVAVLDEIDIWSDRDMTLDLTKKLLEGTEFTVARKNRDPGVVQPIHSFIATNTQPPAVGQRADRDYHVEAVLSRIHPYETRDLDSRDENIARTVAKDESPSWAILCTQLEPYITIPPEYV